LTNRLGKWIFILYTAVLLITATVGSFLAAVLLDQAGLIPHGRYMLEFRESWPFSLMITLVVGLGATTYETLRHQLQSATIELRTRQVEQERANKLLAQARLSSLESRIHPHFLFNTLNSIAALIPRDPQRAEDTVGKLASLLRFSLTEHGGGLVSVEQELKVVRDYLEIESTRFGARLRYSIDVPKSLLQARMPPLALQCLVENAVKHVVAKRPEGAAISIAGAQEGDIVRLEVMDDGPGFSLGAITPEHGLGNLLGRMDLLFGDRGRLHVAHREGHNVVSLAFPAEN
jgi:LytS/YehU family sensor histidine kinase